MSAARPIEQSELHFQRYCDLRGYDCRRIDESKQPRVRSPDYEVFINTQRVIVEVKELIANQEESRNWRKTWSDEIVVHGREPGKRARQHIETAVGQIRPYAQKGDPTVVLLYDNIFIDGRRPYPPLSLMDPLGPYDIDVALFGLQTANLRFHPNGSSESLKDARSRRRKVHDREYITAVSVLYEHPIDTSLFMATYHNFFALVPCR